MAESVTRTVCSLFLGSDYSILMSWQLKGSICMLHPPLPPKALIIATLHTTFRLSVHHPLIAEPSLVLRRVANPETLFPKQRSDLRLHLRLNCHPKSPGACLWTLLGLPPIYYLTLTTRMIRLKKLQTLVKVMRAAIGTKQRRPRQKAP